MPLSSYLLAFICVVGLAAGQLLFKASANAMVAGGTFSTRALLYLGLALALYGSTTLLWVRLLRAAELGKLYPIMALAFVLVPAGSHVLYGESLSVRYFVGVTLIVAGFMLTTP